MKKSLFLALAVLLIFAASCSGVTEVSGDPVSSEVSEEISVQEESSEPEIPTHEFKGEDMIENLTYKNPGEMGDNDGPAFCVYSGKGMNKAEMKLELSAVEHSTVGTGGITVNGFIFLGVDVYAKEGYWINCCDAGVFYSEQHGGWKIFSNTYDSTGNGEGEWYHSKETLDPTRDYLITLDSSKNDGELTLTLNCLDSGEVAMEHTFKLYGTRADGSNTSYLTNFAIDWINGSWIDKNGEPTDKWVEVLKAAEGQGIYFKNIRVYDCALYREGERLDWTSDLTNRRCLMPDSTYDVDGTVVTVHSGTFDTEYIVDIVIE
ncbi:MAG: hypothetical protein J5793_03480 [Clostridia bacterium]|nr:hypothetical protein [Clostridia bacterium]